MDGGARTQPLSPRYRAVVGLGAVVVAAVVLGQRWSVLPAGRPKNLLLVSIDTLRADHVGCYGYARATTPNLDGLFAAGQAFRHAFAAMPTTLPSHAAMMTSRFPSQLGVTQNGETVPPGVATLAEVLAGHGLRTAAFVSATPLDHRY